MGLLTVHVLFLARPGLAAIDYAKNADLIKSVREREARFQTSI